MSIMISDTVEACPLTTSHSSSRKNSNELQELNFNEDSFLPSFDSNSQRESPRNDQSKAVEKELTIKLFHLKDDSELHSPIHGSENND